MAEAYGPTYCTSALVPESKLSHRSESQYGFVPKLSHHGGKTEKTIYSSKRVLVLLSVFSVFPLMMFLVAQQRVMLSGLVRELAHRHKAMTAARKFEKLRHQKRGF